MRHRRPRLLLGLGAASTGATRSARRSWQHVELTVIAVAIGFAIAFPLALLAHRFRRLEQPFGVVSALALHDPEPRALPAARAVHRASRATTVEIALVGYTLVILFPNIVAGLRSAPRRRARGGARDGADAAAGADARRAAARACRRSSAACASPSSRRSRSRRSRRSCCRRGSATRSSSRCKEPTPFKTEIYSAGVLAVALALACDLAARRAAARARPVDEGERVIARRHREPAHVRRRVPLHRRQPGLPAHEDARAARALGRGARRSRCSSRCRSGRARPLPPRLGGRDRRVDRRPRRCRASC